ncbi:FadR family transcriptional regulator [Bacillaceae bacterium Marseille-Q3522]|nr:FadR family transcriptional regulator [Bacillaceae bacterium Marseille-Q3522]
MKKKEKLSQSVVRGIISDIQAEKYSLYTKLPSEMTLAEIYQVSRATIREALSVLKSLGVISSRQGDGHYVEEVDPGYLLHSLDIETEEYRQINHLFELRYMLEPQAAYLAAERRTETDLAGLKQILTDFRKTLDSTSNMGEKEDFRFHKAMVQATGNPFLIRIMDDLSVSYEKALSLTLKQNKGLLKKRQSVYLEHEALYNAISEGQPELAKVLCKMHLDNVKKKLHGLFLLQQ